MRSLLWATALVVMPSVAVGQPSPEVKDGKQVFAITLSPMAAPKPLSNYYLTPQYKEQQPGDQLSGFMKCFMEQALFFNDEGEAKRQKLLEVPLSEFPDAKGNAEALAGIAYPRRSTGLGGNIDLAARYTRAEWNEYFLVRKDGINTLLPEVQSMRRLGLALRVRLRAEIKLGDFDRAIVTVRSLTGLAKMFETHPTIIGNLVGVAIHTMAWNGVEEMIAQPGCPNLYWSLVDVPTPPFSVARGFEGERVVLTTELDSMLALDREMSGREISKVFDFIDGVLQVMGKLEEVGPAGGGKPVGRVPLDGVRRYLQSSRPRYALLAANSAGVEAARGRLVGVGKMNSVAVKAFPPLQVVLTDDLLSHHVWRDEVLKYRNLPLAECLAGMAETNQQMRKQTADLILAPLLLPAPFVVKKAEARTAQRVAFLRILEALRLHAAASNGELPATLADTKLPMPLDPVTGKAFEYSVKDGVATLSGGKIADLPRRVYEVRLRK